MVEISPPSRLASPEGSAMPTSRSKPVWPAYVIALLALFCSLGGPAYAASLITGADVKDGSLTGADLKNGSVKGADVKDGSLASADLSEAAQAALAGQDGETGPSGTAGACGAGQELRWLTVGLTADAVLVDHTVRVGRCLGTGMQVLGDGIVQLPEECDDGNLVTGDGCDTSGMLEGTPGLVFFPSGQLAYVP